MDSVRAISFDLDNTLWDVIPVIEKAELNSYHHLDQHYPRITSRYTLDSIRELRETLHQTRPEIAHDLTELRRQLYAYLLSECGYGSDDSDWLLQRFLDDRNKVTLYPEVTSALERLAGKFTLVSLSDGNADLSVIGIQHFFADCIYSSQVGYSKPHPAGFQKACEVAGTAPSETLHIGDHPISDIEGARNAGLKTMWMRRNGEQWDLDFQPDYSVTTLAEVVDILCD